MPRRLPGPPRVRRHSEGGRLAGVEIFAAGVYRGKRYTVADLDEMISAFNRYSADTNPDGKPQRPLLEVPGVLGHEEEQDLLDNTGIPAAAWLKKVYRRGKTLYGDFEDVPRSVVRLIKGRRYKHVSAEVYDRHPDGLPTAGRRGHMLRRVAFLGGEIPQVKTLRDIPVPEEHSEKFRDGGTLRWVPARLRPSRTRGVRRTAAGTVWVYSEVKAMDREALLKKLSQAGMDTTVLGDDVDEKVLAEMLRVLEGREEEHADDEETNEVDTGDEVDSEDVEEASEDEVPDDAHDSQRLADEDEDADDEDDDDSDAVLEHGDDPDQDADQDEDADDMADEEEPEVPDDPNDHEAMSAYYARMAARHKAMCDNSKKMADAGDKPKAGKGAGSNVQPVAPAVKQGANMLSEEKKRLSRAERRLARIEKYAEKQARAAKRAMLRAKVDALVAAGKVLPAEVENGLLDVLMRTSDAKVLKYSDRSGKTVKRSPLDVMLKTLEARPILAKFGERVKSAKKPGAVGGTAGAEDDDAEVQEVREHFQAYSDGYERNGMTEDRLVQGYKANRKLKGGKLTAREYLNTR